ncbi:hypothetical protein BDP27DRAFT_1449784 [Rhodocollybia butyracea]|uniref:Uncharacterized protein n=1 Tax=Rhodocollybia butyracea TaxID=206335 RepID=A0A9P5PPQ6_9AGAR|nr:hypothetical protein BDP27DRAFT_1449784 [Rhodocollybia butyracea]
MRFVFAAVTLFGCLLFTGISVAKPISARRDLSGISEEISARSSTRLIAPRNTPPTVAVEFVVKLPKPEGTTISELEERVFGFVEKWIKELMKRAQEGKVIPSLTGAEISFFETVTTKPKVMNVGLSGRRLVWFTYTCADELCPGYVSLDTYTDTRGVLFDSKAQIVFPRQYTDEESEVISELMKFPKSPVVKAKTGEKKQ